MASAALSGGRRCRGRPSITLLSKVAMNTLKNLLAAREVNRIKAIADFMRRPLAPGDNLEAFGRRMRFPVPPAQRP